MAEMFIQFLIGMVVLGLLGWIVMIGIESYRWRTGRMEFGDAKFTLTFLIIVGFILFILISRWIGYAVLFATGGVG